MRATTLHKTIVSAVISMVAATACVGAFADRWDTEARKRKAEYAFLESQCAYAQENFDDYALLSKRAYELDPSDLDNAAEWGMILLADNRTDSAKMEWAYQAFRERFFSDPSDYLSGWLLANVARKSGHYADMVAVWETLDANFPTMTQPGEELAQAYIISYLTGDSAAYDKAIGIYNRLESGTGKNIGLSAQKIRAFSTKNDTAAIISEVEALVADAPADSYVALFAGNNYQYLGKMDKALESYNRACELDSTNGNAYMAKAALYNEMGDSLAFDREVFLALRSDNLEVEPKLDILHSYVSELYDKPSQEPRIRQLFSELEQMHRGEPEIHILYAAYLFEIKDYKGASEEMGYAVALDPGNESDWTSYVQMLSVADDDPAVISVGKEAMAKFPDNLYFPIMTADAYRRSGELNAALAVLDSVSIVEPIVNPKGVSSFIAFRGDMLAANGDTIAALQEYDRAIELNPDNYMALNNAAYFMAENNIYLDKAERYSAIVVQNEPDNPTYLDTYAWIFFKKKDYNLARQYIDMTMNLFKEVGEADSSEEEVEVETDGEVEEKIPSSEIYEHAGDIYFMDGDPNQALEFWKKALELDPDNELLARKVKHKTYFYK